MVSARATCAYHSTARGRCQVCKPAGVLFKKEGIWLRNDGKEREKQRGDIGRRGAGVQGGLENRSSREKNLEKEKEPASFFGCLGTSLLRYFATAVLRYLGTPLVWYASSTLPRYVGRRLPYAAVWFHAVRRRMVPRRSGCPVEHRRPVRRGTERRLNAMCPGIVCIAWAWYNGLWLGSGPSPPPEIPPWTA